MTATSIVIECSTAQKRSPELHRRAEIAERFFRERAEHEIQKEAEQQLNVDQRDERQPRSFAARPRGARAIGGSREGRKQTRGKDAPANP